MTEQYQDEQIPVDYGMGQQAVDDSINNDLRDQAFNEDDVYEPPENSEIDENGRDLTQPIDPLDAPPIGDPTEPFDDPYEGTPADEKQGKDPYKRMAQELTTASIGIIYLRVPSLEKGQSDKWRFPCTACMYQMGVNKIPVATVYVGMGGSLMDPSKSDHGPEELLKIIEDRDSKELVYNMLDCELYEERTDKYGWDGPGDLLIFKGYIASACPVYSASAGGSSTQVQFTCFGPAAALMTSPVAAYTETYMGAVMERYRRNAPVSQSDAQASGDILNGFRYDVDQMMQSAFMQKARRQPIAFRIAVCIGAVRVASAWIHTKHDKFKEDDIVLGTIGGTAKLKLNDEWGNGISEECDEAYTRQLLEIFMTRMRQVNLWDTIQSVMTSDAFMMQLVPRWYCDSDAEPDFKMELCPCTAWKPRRDVIKLASGDIVSFKMQHTSFGTLNIPDVFFVNFSDMLAYVSSYVPEFSFGILGVAARTEELQDKLRSDCAYADLQKLNEDTINCRIKEVPAPHWLSCVAPSPKVTNQGSRDNTQSLEVEHTPSKVADESKGPDDENQPHLEKPEQNNPAKATAWDAANAIARTLFLHYYMTGDAVMLELLPDLRFGLKQEEGIFLENSLGDTVEVDLTDSVSKSGLKMRGVLESISYQYAAGKASTATYTATLTRVRLVDAKTPEDEECPIYTSGDMVK